MLPSPQSSCAATCDTTPENETAHSSSALVEDSSAASKLVELQGKIELPMHRLDSTLREKEVLFESKLQDKPFEFGTVTRPGEGVKEGVNLSRKVQGRLLHL